MEYETVLVWHAMLCQIMEYPTIPSLAKSLYDVVVSMRFEEDPKFEFAVNHLSRWMEPFESFEDISKTASFRQGCHPDDRGRTDGRTIGRWLLGRPCLRRTVVSVT
jgi:hypothetical protein